VLVKEHGGNGSRLTFVYEIRADDLHGATTDVELRDAILEVVEPIAGDVTLEKYAAVRDGQGKIVAYDATVTR
jgi:hypothetical protein